MLQSMMVFLLVFTMMKGRWMMVFGGGGLLFFCSSCRFLCTRFLKAICCEAGDVRVIYEPNNNFCNVYRTWFTCSISSCSWACFCLILSSRLWRSVYQETWINSDYNWRTHRTFWKRESADLQLATFLCRVGGEADPFDLFLIFGDDVHGHQNVQSVVNPSSDVLLIVHLLQRKTREKRSDGYVSRNRTSDWPHHSGRCRRPPNWILSLARLPLRCTTWPPSSAPSRTPSWRNALGPCRSSRPFCRVCGGHSSVKRMKNRV